MPAFSRHLPHCHAEMLIIWSNAFVADTGSINIEHVTRPTLAHPMRFTQMRHGLPSGGGRHH